MKFVKSKLVMLISILLCTSGVMADSFTPSHSCYKPNMQVEPNSRAEANQLNSDIDNYKQCILNFVDEQNAAITFHQESAQTAIDEWNRFVKKNGLLVSK